MYVSESAILGLIDHFSDIENFASFEMAMFKENSFKYRIQTIVVIYVNITTLKYMNEAP